VCFVGCYSAFELEVETPVNRPGVRRSASQVVDLPSGEGVTLGRLREFILLPEEKVNDEQAQELAEKEAEYQKNRPVTID
jgi:hypothetical protein